MAARKRRRPRRRRGGLWVAAGLGSAGALAGLYLVGRLGEGPAPGAPEEAEGPAPGRTLRVQGPAGELAVVDGGSGGPPVLLVHGLGGDAGHWVEQLAHLWRGRRAVALDLRGHGASDAAGDGDYSVPAFAQDVVAVAEALELPPFVLVGHSMGGSVAAEVARRRPERVAGLLLVDPNGDQSRLPADQVEVVLRAVRADPHGELRMQFSQVLSGAAPGVREQVLESLLQTRPEALAGAFESLARYGPVEALEGYGGPMLSIVSHLNTLPISLHRLVERLPHHPMPGASHWLMMDRPQELNLLLDAFLDGVRARRADVGSESLTV